MPEARERFGLPNLPLPTLGGRQLWADLHLEGGWRIQKNAVTGRHRLLDRHNIRRAWGTRGECDLALDAFLGAPTKFILFFDLFRGAYRRVPVDATAFPNRREKYFALMIAQWNDNESGDKIGRAHV